MDYFTALNLLHHVAASGSFSASARQLGLAVSSVSRQIDQLEAELGVPLLLRSTRRIGLTNAGQRYLQQTRAILDDLARANQALREDVHSPQGRLCLTLPVDYAAAEIAPHLPEFARRYPRIELELYAIDHFVDLFAEPVDAAIRVGRVKDERLVARRLAPQRRLLCAAPDYLAAHGTPQSPADLEAHNCLAYNYRGYPSRWYCRRDGETITVNARGNLSGNSAAVLLTATLAGQGISHLTDWLIAPYLADGRLRLLLPDWQITPTLSAETNGIYLVYPPDSRHLMKIQVLAGFLAEKLGA